MRHSARCDRARRYFSSGWARPKSRRDLTEYRKRPEWKFSKEKRRNQMRPSTKDQIKGKFHELKGDVKEKAGQVTNNTNLETTGQNERLAGKVQRKVGQIEEVLGK
jgi:uncharacterized protein YjbJ (UPF0337 family)